MAVLLAVVVGIAAGFLTREFTMSYPSTRVDLKPTGGIGEVRLVLRCPACDAVLQPSVGTTNGEIAALSLVNVECPCGAVLTVNAGRPRRRLWKG